MNNLKSKILSILFISTKPVSLAELESSLDVSADEIKTAVNQIIANNSESGIILLAHNNKLQLATNPENSPEVKKFLSLEMREKLSDAALETLAVIAYRQPVSKAEIENIRGVSSQYTIRQLLIRGLIEKAGSDNDRRIQNYRTTLEFMQHLGLQSMQDLPDFDEITKNIQLPEAPTNLADTSTAEPKPIGN